MTWCNSYSHVQLRIASKQKILSLVDHDVCAFCININLNSVVFPLPPLSPRTQSWNAQMNSQHDRSQSDIQMPSNIECRGFRGKTWLPYSTRSSCLPFWTSSSLLWLRRIGCRPVFLSVFILDADCCDCFGCLLPDHVYLKHPRITFAAHVQHMCNTRATHVQHTCNIRAT